MVMARRLKWRQLVTPSACRTAAAAAGGRRSRAPPGRLQPGLAQLGQINTLQWRTLIPKTTRYVHSRVSMLLESRKLDPTLLHTPHLDLDRAHV